MKKYLLKKTINLSITLAIVFIATSFTYKPQTYSLKVKVNDLRNNIGVVQFALYNKEGSIPDEKYKAYYKIKISTIHKNSSSIIFENIPLGKYAINILHDENKDGKIDKGWVLPTEGVGFSNYQSIGLGNRPKFSKASFELNKNKTVTVKIIYM